MADRVDIPAAADGGPGPAEPKDLPGAGLVGSDARRGFGLTEEDRDLLIEAIQKGTGSEPPTLADVIFDFVKILVVIGLLWAAWVWTHHWHPDVNMSYGATSTGTLTSLTLGAANGTVGWTVPAVYASAVAISGPATETALVTLPISPQRCQLVGAHLGLTCQHGQLVVPDAIKLTWNSPQLLYLSPPSAVGASAGPQESAAVNLQLSASSSLSAVKTPPAGAVSVASSQVDLTVTGPGSLNWCYGVPTPNAAITLRNGSLSYGVPPADVRQEACGQGLAVAVQGNTQFSGFHRAPEMTFETTTSFTLQATTHQIDAQDLNSTFHLGGAGVDSISPAEEVELYGPGPNAIHTTLNIVGSKDNLTLSSAKLASASSDGTQLVTSWWDRDSTIALPLFLAAFGIVLALVPSWIDKLWKWGRSPGGAKRLKKILRRSGK
jgi:hypothetical protein